jgi:hypothetical protein
MKSIDLKLLQNLKLEMAHIIIDVAKQTSHASDG